jgi:enoyl-CoA hydratase/carnithine racemase
MKTQAQIVFERRGGIAIANFFNPPDGLMDSALLEALEQVLDTLEGDAEIRVLVFAGSVPGAFIRHYDVREIGQLLNGGAAEQIERMHEAYGRVAALPYPTIAAIDGACMGGGLEFALCCDLRLASPSAGPFGFPECSIGIFPATGGTQRAPRAIGRSKALELMLTGRLFDAEEALQIGLLHRVVDGVNDAALRLARRLEKMPKGGLRAIKQLVLASEPGLESGFSEERRLFARLVEHDVDTRTALAAQAAVADPSVR